MKESYTKGAKTFWGTAADEKLCAAVDGAFAAGGRRSKNGFWTGIAKAVGIPGRNGKACMHRYDALMKEGGTREKGINNDDGTWGADDQHALNECYFAALGGGKVDRHAFAAKREKDPDFVKSR